MRVIIAIKMLFSIVLIVCLSNAELLAQVAVLTHSYTFDDGSANDQVGNADGQMHGGKIENGKYITSANGQYIELPAQLIKLNTYSSLSFEAYIVAGKDNNISTMLSFFGRSDGQRIANYFFQSVKSRGFTRSVIACKNYSNPWMTSTSVRCNALDDGQPHHVVTTFDDQVLKLYVDGLLVGSQSNEPFPVNILSNLGEQVAYLCKSGYDSNPTWLGSIDAFNIYEGILDAETIEKSAQDYLPERVYAVRSQLTDLIPAEGMISNNRLDTLKYGISLSDNWSYHAGDDLAWAAKTFDDGSWPLVRSFFYADSLQGTPWKGIGWFRREIKIDSTLYSKRVGFSLRQTAASEIYLNGKLIKSYGQIGNDSINEMLYNPNFEPFFGVLDTCATQVIAIRYSNQNALKHFRRYGNPAKNIGFNFAIGGEEKLRESTRADFMDSAVLLTSFPVFFLAFTILNLMMFFFYFKGKENFFIALYTGSATIIFGIIAYAFFTRQISEITYIMQLLIVMLVPLLMASYVFFLYTVFYKKMPRQFWPIVFSGTIISIVSITPLRAKFDFTYLLVPFILLLLVEGFRVVIKSIVQKKRNAIVIGTGVSIFSISLLLFVADAIFSNSISKFFGNSVIFSGVLSLPLTMLIYLARERARTRIDLENRIMEVEQLSEKALEQEKRTTELKVENARKEVELQKAAELKTAYLDLERAHENLKATQKQLVQAEKMASLGELTAGIAHEIQNPLNFVNNFSEVNGELITELEEEVEKGNLEEISSIIQDLKDNELKINHHGKRAEAIVKGMLLHSRSSSGQKEPSDINKLADEYLRLSYHGLRAKDKSFNADYKLEADENLPLVNVVPQDIGRVLLNLINNAFYAVSEKRKNHPYDYQPRVVVSTALRGDRVEIGVSDNGSGIPKDVLDKIYQPFFTTKPAGQGTGLGLSMSYDIITKGHRGSLTVDSKEGIGTEFKILIPIA
ncbi:ATP-binding protein [Mangrovibacterium diazotrophicum]|uniref:histidine kinase n=1 Tax=Mangrovibacterium diazotrophicum TaxID=1261403 RepID=A0A419W449_9BACT|nr:ATP-binding protein [Mangrovibacterium diazotrophicum]RKD90220.1 phospho-acceptor domain-containing protein [Mangrovibacterium diazotrophicum]